MFGAEYYHRYRPSIPDAVAHAIRQAAPHRTPRRLLDIAAGTGLATQALLSDFDDIIAIDSDASMLAVAEQNLRDQATNDQRLTFTSARAEEFTPPPGWMADLVTICRAFHWLDQPTVLAHLDHQVAPDGVVAIFSERSFWSNTDPWQKVVREVIQSFLGDERRAGEGHYRPPQRPYLDVLRESAFNRVDVVNIPVERAWTGADVLGYVFSTSFAAPSLFKERRAEFANAVTERLAEFSDDDTFVEHNEFTIYLARRGR